MIKNQLIAIGKNFIVLLSSLIICSLFLEFVVFRHIVHVSELPRNIFINSIIKYEPNQKGKYFVDTYGFNYKINAQGWNSKYQQYSIEKNNKFRIAIIGDSFVEALQVNFDKSLAEQLEMLFGNDIVEVYRFGINGAPLSEYLQILRQEVIHYNPDLVIIVIVHNDFMESYEMVPGRYYSSFLKLKVIDGENIQEIPPVSYHESLMEYLSRISATLRFLRMRYKMQLKNFFETYLFSDKRHTPPANYQANVDISQLDQKKEKNIRATEYIFQEFLKLQELKKFQLLLVMDGDRLSQYGQQSIYQGKVNRESPSDSALSLNVLASEAAKKFGLPFIDMHPIFAKDFQLHNKRFEYNENTHWNEYGHQVVAQAIYQFIVDKGWVADRRDLNRIP
jgi:lysophospholipase L1-like esterase